MNPSIFSGDRLKRRVVPLAAIALTGMAALFANGAFGQVPPGGEEPPPDHHWCPPSTERCTPTGSIIEQVFFLPGGYCPDGTSCGVLKSDDCTVIQRVCIG